MLTQQSTKLVQLANRRIYEQAKLKRALFLERVECVRGIRKFWNSFYLSWYPTSLSGWALWEGLHNAVNHGDFSNIGARKDYFPFGLLLPEPLYDYLRRNELVTVQKQIIAFLAGLWQRDPEKRQYIKEQVYPLVFQRVESALATVFDQSYDNLELPDELRSRYHADFRKFTGAGPAEFLDLIDYADFKNASEARKTRWAIESDFSMGYGHYYFTGDDWNHIVLQGKPDDLQRSESDTEIWEAWLLDFKTRPIDDTGPVRFFAESESTGYIYIIGQESSNLYKIGWTTNADPTVRLKALQTGSAMKLVLCGHFSAPSQKTEFVLHEMFNSNRMQGEWFCLTEEQVRLLLDETWRRSQQIL